MSTTALPSLDYASLNHALQEAGNTMDAAEAHGIMCGVLCASTNSEATAWVPLLLNEVDKSKKTSINTLSAMLIREHEHLRQQLRDPGFAFEPLLPAEAFSLVQRGYHSIWQELPAMHELPLSRIRGTPESGPPSPGAA